jgi:hypothetical protein
MMGDPMAALSEFERTPIWAEGSCKEGIPFYRERHDCPLDKRHVTGQDYLTIAVDLLGVELGDFVPFSEPLSIISKQFADRLMKTSLTGYEVKPKVEVVYNQCATTDQRLLYLEFAGVGGKSNRLVVEGGPNVCPHCGKSAMVCPGCGERNWPKCAECDNWTLYLPEAPEYSDENGFEVEGYPPERYIVEAKLWDGCDFFTADDVRFVSNRAKLWMEKVGAWPVVFEPALLNTEGV